MRQQFVRALQVGFGVGARAHIDRLLELHGQDPQGADIVRIYPELMAQKSTLHYIDLDYNDKIIIKKS